MGPSVHSHCHLQDGCCCCQNRHSIDCGRGCWFGILYSDSYGCEPGCYCGCCFEGAADSRRCGRVFDPLMDGRRCLSFDCRPSFGFANDFGSDPPERKWVRMGSPRRSNAVHSAVRHGAGAALAGSRPAVGNWAGDGAAANRFDGGDRDHCRSVAIRSAHCGDGRDRVRSGRNRST